MKHETRNKKKLKGQGSIEFMLLFPIFMVLILLIISMALQWHSFHVATQGSLEAASKGNRSANESAYNEAVYAGIEIHKTDDAQPGTYSIESASSYTIGYTADGIAKNVMVNDNYSLLGNPPVKGYVQAPSTWDFIPCDIGCN